MPGVFSDSSIANVSHISEDALNLQGGLELFPAMDVSLGHLSEDCIDLQRDFESPSEDVRLEQFPVQDTLNFPSVKLNSKQNPTEITNEDLRAVHQKLDVLLENTNTSICSKITQDNMPEAIDSLGVLKKASNITDINGSGISFYQGNDDSDAIVRCDTCFEAECDNNPSLSSKDPFFLGHTNISSNGGRSLALGLVINQEKKSRYIEGHNQEWYRFKKTLTDHVSCTSSRHGGNQHLQGLISKKRRDKQNQTILNAVCSQLKAALTTVKMKSASLHYEDLIGLLHSCGSNVGNLGHGRKQVNLMIKAFQAYMLKKLNKLLSKPLSSTGIPPHF